MANDSTTVVLVSVLPRGEPFGASALVALDPATLRPLAIREFPASEYLEDPELGEPGRIRHSRGIAQAGNRLFVALFNGVHEYVVEDATELRLEAGRLLTHPRAVDLHGICVRDGSLFAASTGSDSIVRWDLDSGEAAVMPLLTGGTEDVRFPDRLARQAGRSDWRDVLQARLHVNGISVLADGAAVVCSLTQLMRMGSDGLEPILEEPGARMHDGCICGDRELLLTDAARGMLVSLDMGSGECRRMSIADPEEWFVRGIGVIDGKAYVLSSETMPSRQRDPELGSNSTAMMGGSFSISVVELGVWALTAEEVLRLSEIPRGAVAYGLLGWKS